MNNMGMGSQHGSQHGSHGSHSPMSSQAMKQQQQQQMRNGVQDVHAVQQQRPFVVSSGLNSSPELDLMASCQPLPEATIPLPESVMNGTLDDIVDQVISDSSLSTVSQ